MARAALVAVGVALAGAAAAALYLAVRPHNAAAASPDVASAIRQSKKTNPEAWRRKVVVLGFDSCDPDLVDQMIREGKLPNFARLRREGASGFLETTQPALSPVVWTTVATGMPPERHGILDFLTETPRGMVPVSSRMRQADTVWELLSHHGEEVGVVGWLVTWPAEPVNGFVVTDKMGQLAYDFGRELDPDLPQRTWPEDLAEEIEKVRVTVDDLPLAKIRPFADVSEDEYRAAYSTKFVPTNLLGNLRLTIATAETFRAAGEKLYDENRPRFFALYFEAMDAISHLCMRYAPPKLPEVDEETYLKYRTAIEANYVWHDRVLGHYLERADADTTILVVSDHGFRSGALRRGDPSDFHAKTGAMWHREYGVFFAWGFGVARGARVDGASVLDVTPTILASMGYPKPADMPGKVLTAAFEGGLAYEEVPTYFGETRRARLVEENLSAGPSVGGLTPEEQADKERLASIGYVGGERDDPATTHMNLASRFLSAWRLQDAKTEYEKAVAKHRNPGTLGGLAQVLLLLGETAEARKLVDEALRKDPSDVGCRITHARLLLRESKEKEAEAAIRALVADKPELFQPHAQLALILEGRAYLAKQRGDAKEALRCQADALVAHEAALRLEPNHIPSLLAAARLLLTMREDDLAAADSAKRFLDHLLQLRPEAAAALNNHSIALMRKGIGARLSGRREEARAFLEQALVSATKATEVWQKQVGRPYVLAHANRAYVLWQLDRIDDAADAARTAREGDPSYVFNARFVAALAQRGYVLPPPAPKPTDAEVPEEPAKKP